MFIEKRNFAEEPRSSGTEVHFYRNIQRWKWNACLFWLRNRKDFENYFEVRETITLIVGHEHALFYSTQKKRNSIQAIENLVKKYSKEITTIKKITPHKLRSTYGTSLYQDEYSCGSKSRIRKFGNQSSGTRKSPFLCLITVPFLWEYLSRPCRICGA